MAEIMITKGADLDKLFNDPKPTKEQELVEKISAILLPMVQEGLKDKPRLVAQIRPASITEIANSKHYFPARIEILLDGKDTFASFYVAERYRRVTSWRSSASGTYGIKIGSENVPPRKDGSHDYERVSNYLCSQAIRALVQKETEEKLAANTDAFKEAIAGFKVQTEYLSEYSLSAARSTSSEKPVVVNIPKLTLSVEDTKKLLNFLHSICAAQKV